MGGVKVLHAFAHLQDYTTQVGLLIKITMGQKKALMASQLILHYHHKNIYKYFN
jgi:hypothetical protein